MSLETFPSQEAPRTPEKSLDEFEKEVAQAMDEYKAHPEDVRLKEKARLAWEQFAQARKRYEGDPAS